MLRFVASTVGMLFPLGYYYSCYTDVSLFETNDRSIVAAFLINDATKAACKELCKSSNSIIFVVW